MTCLQGETGTGQLLINESAFALVIAVLGLEGVEVFAGQAGLKRGLLIFSGVLTWISGLTTLTPISIVAYTTVVEFWDEAFLT
ncbi:hypothetical protein WMY93_004672 [Mugilogobius chulae]|uniref:Uncharacterized protein n=1 Tax=Mugilogobius chulae TaxID=88201 RepID=A0AAW0PZY3_9GOBI